MKFRHLLIGTCVPALFAANSGIAYAQVLIEDAQTTTVSTSTASDAGTPADVTISSAGSVTVESGNAVVLDSDNVLINDGTISSTDNDDVTGVLISGGNTGSFSNIGAINISEATDAAFTDGVIPDGGDIAVGSGRTGILISGGGFTGNVENSSNGGSINVRGQDSSGIRLASGSSITGDLLQNGAMQIYGERSIGLNVVGDVIGNLAMGGAITAIGEDAQAANISGDVSGGISIRSALTATGFVANTGASVAFRPNAASREALEQSGGTDQAGSALSISGNVGSGLFVGEVRNDEDLLVGTGSVSQFGSAPAILIDGEGTAIAIGQVSLITDTDDEDYDEDLLYAFVNQGTIAADGVLDNLNATALSVADATLTGGINNTRSMAATVYRSGDDLSSNIPTNDSHARVIVIGNNAIAERINNAGAIRAIGIEAIDTVYIDRDNILQPNRILATAIDIDANGSVVTIDNTGAITAAVTGRIGEATAIRDASGTLLTINNHNQIQAAGLNSDALGDEATNFTTIAIDVSANTAGFTLNQTIIPAPVAEEGETQAEDTIPLIAGDILLGSGDDFVNVQGGSITGDIAFGAGADRLTINNSSTVSGAVTDSDGQLEILVSDNSILALTTTADLNASSASFDETSTFSPFIDPSNGQVSSLNTSGDVTFEDGAVIAPQLATVLTDTSSEFVIVDAGGTLSVDTSQATLRSDQTPYLYNTAIGLSATDPNTLVMTLDLRTTEELGLDAQQAGVFTSAFEALQSSNSLGGAFTRITDQSTFNAAYNQLLPEFAAAARQFVIANVDGASGAVGTHLDNARRSQEEPGGAWIQEFAYYADRDLAGFSEQFRGYGFGITGGFDTAFGPFHTVGINLGFATTEIEDVVGNDEPLDVFTLQGGLYAGYETGKLGIDMYVGGGYNDFEQNRRVEIGTFDEEANADWSGTHLNASLSAGYDAYISDKYFIRPVATVTYLSLNEKAYQETGNPDIALAIDSRKVNTATASATLNLGARFETSKGWWTPALRVGYRNDFINDRVVTSGQFVNGTVPFEILAQEFPNSGFVLGLTLASGTKYSSFGLDLDSDIRDGFSRHTARLVLRLLF